MKRLLLVLIIVIFSTVLVLAEDDQGNSNDPNDNDRANACYDGTMEGKCDTEWEWECGWYLIRFEYATLSREAFPGWCASLLPPIIESDDEVSVPTGAGCQLFTGTYVFFSGNFLPVGAVTYLDAGCTTPDITTLVATVYAPAGVVQATNICAAHGLGFGGAIAGNVYHCA